MERHGSTILHLDIIIALLHGRTSACLSLFFCRVEYGTPRVENAVTLHLTACELKREVDDGA